MSTPVEIFIRAATRKDIAEVTALLAELNREEGYSTSADANAIGTLLFPEAPGKVLMRALVAKKGSVIVGTALYYWGYDTVSASHGYHLADIIVARAHRSQGIGARLFAALAAQCLAESGQWISLTALKKNERAQGFYRKLGMVEVAVNFFAIGAQGMTRCIVKHN